MRCASLSQRGERSNNYGRTLRFPAGTVLFDLKRPSRRIERLDSGRVRLLSDSRAVLEQLEPGDFFGESSLCKPRWGGQIALALSPVEIAVFSKSKLLERMQQDRRFASALLRNLARRLQRYQKTVNDFVTEPAERRLAFLLARLVPSRRASDWVRLPVGLTNIELAKTIGTTRGRVSYFLNRFERLGWLRRHEGLWIDRDGLSRFLGSSSCPGEPEARR